MPVQHGSCDLDRIVIFVAGSAYGEVEEEKEIEVEEVKGAEEY